MTLLNATKSNLASTLRFLNHPQLSPEQRSYFLSENFSPSTLISESDATAPSLLPYLEKTIKEIHEHLLDCYSSDILFKKICHYLPQNISLGSFDHTAKTLTWSCNDMSLLLTETLQETGRYLEENTHEKSLTKSIEKKLRKARLIAYAVKHDKSEYFH